MYRRLSLLVALLVVGSSFAVAPVAGVEDPRFETYVPEPTLTPGETTQLSVQFMNDAEEVDERVETASNVKATMEAGETPFSIQSGTRLLGTLEDGEPVSDQFTLTVPRDVAPGTYQVPVELTYEYEGDERETETVYATVRVEDRASFSLENVTSDLSAGESGTVAVTIQNTGNEVASGASVDLQSTTDNVMFGSNAETSTFVGDWEPNESKTVSVSARAPDSADEGTYSVSTTVSYDDADGIDQTSFPMTAGVTVAPERDRFAFADVDHSLRVGEEGTVSMTVTNDGATADDVVVTLADPGQNVHPLETEYAVGTLEAGASTDVSFPVEISEDGRANPRQFTFSVDYEDRDGDEWTAGPTNVRLEIEPERDRFSVSPVNATVEAGGSETVTVAVTNEGDEVVSNVNAKVFANDPLSADDDEAYVDSLEPGETTQLTFGVSVAGSASEKAYPLSMDFRYDEGSDTELSKTYQVPITATAAESSALSTVLVVGVVAVLVVVGYLWYRRR